jgi:hypothetical protein
LCLSCGKTLIFYLTYANIFFSFHFQGRSSESAPSRKGALGKGREGEEFGVVETYSLSLCLHIDIPGHIAPDGGANRYLSALEVEPTGSCFYLIPLFPIVNVEYKVV